MKTLRSHILLIIFLLLSYANAQNLPWGYAIGNKVPLGGNYYQYLHDVVFYGKDILYAAGRFNNNLTLGNDSLSTPTSNGFWLSKMTSEGKVNWVKKIGESPGMASGLIEINCIEPDTINRCIYIGGSINPGTYIFGNDTISLSYYPEIFLAKLDTAGNPIWTKISQNLTLPPILGSAINDIVISQDSGIVVCGMHGSARLWLGDTLITNGGTNKINGFVSKIDESGSLVWNQQMLVASASPFFSNSYAKSITVNPNGTCLVAGTFIGDTLQIGNLKLGNGSMGQSFLAFLDPLGNPVYVRGMGESARIYPAKLNRLERFGDYVYGIFMFKNSLFIPELNQTFSATYSGAGSSCIVLKMRKTGVVEKATLLPTTQSIYMADLYLKSDQTEIYTLSLFEDATSVGGLNYSKGFNLTTIDSSGAILCNVPITNGISTLLPGPSLDGNGHGRLVMGSQLVSPLNLGSLSLDNYNTELGLLLSLQEGFCGSVPININTQAICPTDSVLQIAPPGYASYHWSNGDKNDSTYIRTKGQHSCWMTDYNGRIWTTFGFQVNFISPFLSAKVFGDNVICRPGDSLTLSTDSQWTNVSWNNGAASGNNIIIDSAGLYFFSGEDPYRNFCTFKSDTLRVIESDLDSLELAGIPGKICPGDSINPTLLISKNIDSSSVSLSINQQIKTNILGQHWHFDTSGAYVIILSGRDLDSCDYSSIYTIDVSAPSVIISKNLDSLYSNYSEGNQWYFNGSLLSGDTLRYLSINQNGTYSLVVTDSIGCTDSTSIQITDIRISEFTSGGLEVYPNPVGNELRIVLTEGFFAPGTLQINDVTGRNLRSYQVSTRSSIIDVSGLPSGVYLLSFHHYRIKLEKL